MKKIKLKTFFRKNANWIFGGIGTSITVIIISFLVSNKKGENTITGNTIIKDSPTIQNTTINNNYYNNIQVSADTLNPILYKFVIENQFDTEAKVCNFLMKTRGWQFKKDSSFYSMIKISDDPNILIQETGKWQWRERRDEVEIVYDRFPDYKYILTGFELSIGIVNK